MLCCSWIDTPLGPMIAISDDAALLLLEFADRRGLEKEVERLRAKMKAAILPGENTITASIKKELKSYFSGASLVFETPITYTGTSFQCKVWDYLRRIKPGHTSSYMEIASAIDCPKGYRAVGRANGLNQLSLIVPCHRVINANGDLGGYGGGLERKKWLLEHEAKHMYSSVVQP